MGCEVVAVKPLAAMAGGGHKATGHAAPSNCLRGADPRAAAEGLTLQDCAPATALQPLQSAVIPLGYVYSPACQRLM